MSVLITGMEMPKSCLICVCDIPKGNCDLWRNQTPEEHRRERHPDCPLVEINDEKIVKVATLEDVREAVNWAVGEIKGGMDWVETNDLKGYPLKEIIALAESECE